MHMHFRSTIRTIATYLVIRGIKLFNPTGHVKSDITIGKVTLREAVRKNTLLLPIRVDILHCVIRKVDLFGAIGIVLLTLFATITYTVCKSLYIS